MCIQSGRSDLYSIVEGNLRSARGEVGVVVCGPIGLMARTKNVVAQLSDERGAGKGTSAPGMPIFAEGFGW